MNTSPARAIGFLAVTTGILILISVAFSTLLYFTGGFRVWAMHAFLVALGVLLNMVLAWKLHTQLRTQSLRWNQFMLLIEMIGSLVVLIGVIWVIGGAVSGRLPLYQAWILMAFGYAFIGLWLLLLNLHARSRNRWSRSL